MDAKLREIETFVEKASVPSGISLNDWMSSISNAADASIRDKYSISADSEYGSYPGYCREIYEEFVIYRVYGQDSAPGHHLKASYSLVEGKIQFGEWVDVIEQTSYVTVQKDRWRKPGLFDNVI